MEKLYFGSVDDTFCQPLEDHMTEAKYEGFTEITLVEAVPDFDNKEHIWCTHYGEVAERQECKKAHCEHYNSKSGRGVCSDRGRLYTFGEEVTFKVE